jgi:hypothetical protein
MSNRESTLGLTEAEIIWLRANMGSDKNADGLIRQYQMVTSASQDPGARGIFAAMLDDARKSFLAGLQ